MRSGDIEIFLAVGRLENRIPDSDRAAVGQAVGQANARVRVYRSADEDAVRYALAAGVPEASGWLEDPADLVVFGRGGAGPAGEYLPALAALEIQADMVFEVLEFRLVEGGVSVIRDLGRGVREYIILEFPVVLVMSDQAESDGYVSRYRQRHVPSDCRAESNAPVSVASVGSQRDWQTARRRVKSAGIAKKTAGSAQTRMFDTFGLTATSTTQDETVISADATTCANHLLRYLAHHEFIELAGAELPSIVDGDGQSSDPDGIDANVVGIEQVEIPSESPLNRVPRPVGDTFPPASRGPFRIPHLTDSQ